MFPKEVSGKLGWISRDRSRFRFRKAGGIWLTCGDERMCAGAPPCGKMFLHIAFFDESHGKSSCSVACLNGARLEPSLECRRREGRTLTTSFELTRFASRVPG